MTVLVSDFPNFQNFPARVTNAFPLTPRRSRNWGVSLTYRFGGRDYRLTDVHGRVVREMIA